ncbi:MAG: hypothetical protein IJ722_02710 [Alloprevotella sp.]|nr:hypothetical protein [Alloprevotella sp.]
MDLPPSLEKHLLWLARLSRRKGFGLQSPFAYNLVTRVVHERGEYYAYGELGRQRAGATLPERDDRLLLRLANDFRPRHCLLLGGVAAVTRAYLQAGCSACRFSETPGTDGLQPEMLLALPGGTTSETLADALASLAPRALIVLPGIRDSVHGRTLWRQVLAHPACRTSFDFCIHGIAYTDSRLTQAHYVVSFP